MDKKTFIQFLIISAVFIIGWEFISRHFELVPVPPEKDDTVVSEETVDDTDEPDKIRELAEEEIIEKPPGENEKEEEPDIEAEEGLQLANSMISTEWTSRGAGLQKVKLLNYKAPYFEEDEETGEPQRPVLTLLSPIQEGTCSDVIESVSFINITSEGRISPQTIPMADQIYKIEEHASNRLVFTTTVEDKLGIRKTVEFSPDAYHYTSFLEFQNLTDRDIEFEFQLRTAAGIEREMLGSRYLSSVVALQENSKFDFDLIDPGKIDTDNRLNESTNIAWTGMISQYFIAMAWPESREWIRAVESEKIDESNIRQGKGRWDELRGEDTGRTELARKAENNPNATTKINSRRISLASRTSESFTYDFVSAPIDSEILDSYKPGLAFELTTGRMPAFTRILTLGTISFLSPLMVRILGFFYSIIPNYGVAILLLTLLIRGALHPLTRSSQISMHKMKKLQPQIQELTRKHGEDRQRMAQEQWKLYSKYGVHPMKGCFPMLLQMPVFIALFTTLRTSVQLRQASFIPGWINDLSQPDTIWEMPFSLPIMGNNLNLLPFIMVFAWMMNQKLTPTPADPKAQQQQKIMKWLPVLFAFMFYNFASGLLLYITTSSFIGALEHWHIRKKADSVELTPVNEEKKKKKQEAKSTKQKKGKNAEHKKSWIERLAEGEELKKKNSRQIRNKDKDKNKNKKI